MKSYCENASLSIRCILLLSSEIFLAPESEMKVWFVIWMKKFCPISTTSIDSNFCWLEIVEFNLESNFKKDEALLYLRVIDGFWRRIDVGDKTISPKSVNCHQHPYDILVLMKNYLLCMTTSILRFLKLVSLLKSSVSIWFFLAQYSCIELSPSISGRSLK